MSATALRNSVIVVGVPWDCDFHVELFGVESTQEVKILLYLVIAILQLAAAVFGFFILLLGLNGFTERQATASLIFFIALSLVTVLGDGVLRIWVARLLSRKLSVGAVAAISTIGVVVFGVVVLIVGLFAAFVLAEVVRGMS